MNTLWQASKPLTAMGLIMIPVFLLTLIGLALDPRIITGAPAWLKPAKFAISTAIYALTLAWIFTYLTDWPRLKSITGGATAAILVIEVAIIYLQAARGKASHFNAGTVLDGVLFALMGVGIMLVLAASIAVAWVLFQQPFSDPAMGWALRMGVLITVLGSATGGLMVRPTQAQLEQARITRTMPVAGAHTVGAPDGGPGLPGTGWSREHGDLRVPHFIGLHAMQILPLFAWLMGRNRPSLVLVAGVAYAALYVILLVQALNGRPLFGPFLRGLA